MSNCNCDNSNCGPSREPCDSSLPETCEPLEQVTSGVRLVVEDENSCKRGLISDEESSMLLYDANGEVIWRDGSSAQPIYLPSIQTVREEVEGVIVSDNGTIKSLQGTLAAAETEVLTHNGTDFLLQERSTIFGSGSGVLVRNPSTTLAAWATGTENQVLTINSSGVPVFDDLPTVQVSGFVDLNELSITYSTQNTLSITLSGAVLESITGETSIYVTNSPAIVVDITATGANGREGGLFTAGQYVWVHVIYNPTTATLAGYVSLTPDTIGLPSGYTYRRLIGLFRTNSSSKIPSGFVQNGSKTHFGTGGFIEINLRSGAVNTFAAVQLTGATAYPSSSYVDEAFFVAGIWGTATSTAKYVASIANSGDVNPALTAIETYGGTVIVTGTASTSVFTGFSAVIPAQGTVFARTDAASLGAGDFAGLYISGFSLEL